MVDVDFYIAFSIVMLLLSFISERFSNFLKLHFQNKRIWIFYPHRIRKRVRRDNGQEAMDIDLSSPSSDRKTATKSFAWGFSTELKLLSGKQPTKKAEKEREYRIITINILVGVLVATLANADFFHILENLNQLVAAVEDSNPNVSILPSRDIRNIGFKEFFGAAYMILLLWSISLMLFNRLYEVNTNRSRQQMRIPFLCMVLVTIVMLILDNPMNRVLIFPNAWNCDCGYREIIQKTLGFAITGLFLSLGSKFWHDLLDILFKFKNVKQRLNETSTYTDYDSADKLLALASTSNFKVAEQLYNKYKDEIWAIPGVVSLGLITHIDENGGGFKKRIEVEYTTPEAQAKLDRLLQEGSVTIDFNTFYLHNYLYKNRTESLIAIPNSSALSSANSEIQKSKPICYAYNINAKKNLGSFGVFAQNGEYFGHSNLHVLAVPSQLETLFGTNNLQALGGNNLVRINIGGIDYPANSNKKGYEITRFEFNNDGGNGRDYCEFQIDRKAYFDYLNFLEMDWLKGNSGPNLMKMFGARSKYLAFFDIPEQNEIVQTKVTYFEGDGIEFTVELGLVKIKSQNRNVMHGDSGSIVYPKKTSKDRDTSMLVSKSDDYAYMFNI